MSSGHEQFLMLKMVLIGDPAVGKTSLRRKYLGQSFVHSHLATIGVDFAQKYVFMPGYRIRLVLWDLAGQQGYESVRRHYYQGCSAIVLVYAVDDRRSFDSSSKWLVEAHKYMKHSFPPVAILANKVDLRDHIPKEELVSTEEGEAFTETFKEKLGVQVIYRETSALSGENVLEVFNTLTKNVVDTYFCSRHK